METIEAILALYSPLLGDCWGHQGLYRKLFVVSVPDADNLQKRNNQAEMSEALFIKQKRLEMHDVTGEGLRLFLQEGRKWRLRGVALGALIVHRGLLLMHGLP